MTENKPMSIRKGHEPKEVCPTCKKDMYKQSIRPCIKGKHVWWPTSWICLYCGHMKLDKKRFNSVKKELPKITTNIIAKELNVDPNSKAFKEWAKTINDSID